MTPSPSFRRAACALLAVLAVTSGWACGGGDALIEGDEATQDFDGFELDDPGFSDDTGTSEQGLNAAIIDAEELQVLNLINDYRAGRGLGKLKVSIALTRAANAHSKDMAATGTMSHDSSNGTSFGTRVNKYYTCWTKVAENVGRGASGSSIFAAWKASDGHNKNMLDGALKVIGISKVVSASGQQFWTTDFGDCVDALLSAGFSTIASNGGFESDSFGSATHTAVRTVNRWHRGGTSSWSAKRDARALYSGSYGLRQVDPSGGSVSTTQLVKAAANVNYTLAAKGRRVSGSSSQVMYLDFLDGAYKRLSRKTVSLSASSWTTLKAEAVSPAGTKYVRIFFYGSGSSGVASTADWDGVSLKAW